METKRLILVMAIGMALVLGWPRLTDTIGRSLGYDMTRRPELKAAQAEATPSVDATPVAALPPTTSPTTASASAAAAIAPATGAGGYAVLPSTRPAVEPVRLGSADAKDPTFALALDVSPSGAGLEDVVLNDYRLTLRSPEPFTFDRPGATAPNRTRSLAVRGVRVDGVDVDLTGASWTLVDRDADAADGSVAATFELTLARGGVPALALQRTYTVYTRAYGPREVNGKTLEPLGFESRVANAFKNLTGQPMSVALRYNGQGVPPSESERYIDAFYVLGTSNAGGVESHGDATSGVNATGVDLVRQYAAKGRPWFTGAMTTYFVALQRFEPVPKGTEPVDRFASVVATTLTPERTDASRETEVLITTTPVDVGPDASTEFASRVYFGPRKREFLTNAYYAQPWIRYDTAFVLSQGFTLGGVNICGLCTWQWLINILFSVLTSFHFVLRDWGLSIIGLVFLVRLCLHPITKRSQLNMLKFGKLAPEMTKIKERYKDDQEAMNRAMMGFYKEHGSTQLMGCLPMFLQMPIWIALWQAMQSTFELRHESFFYGHTWIHDLSKPDHLIDFAAHGWPIYHLPFIGTAISGINLLPFLYGAVQFFQFKIQPKPPTMTEEQRQQQQMTQWMMLILMPVMLYASPSGLMIYMITSFTIGFVETKIVRRQFEASEAHAAKFTVVDNDSPAAAGAEKAKVRRVEPKSTKKATGFMAMIEEARRKAQAMQAEMEKNRKKGR